MTHHAFYHFLLVKASHNASSDSGVGKQMGRAAKSYCKEHRSTKARTIIALFVIMYCKAEFKPSSNSRVLIAINYLQYKIQVCTPLHNIQEVHLYLFPLNILSISYHPLFAYVFSKEKLHVILIFTSL